MSNEKGNENSLKFINWEKSVQVLHELGAQGLTMYSGSSLNHVAEKFRTSADCVRQNAKRHDPILQIIKAQNDEIRRLKTEIESMKAATAQGIGPNCNRQPWEMTTPEFLACLKLEWQDPFPDGHVGFGTPAPDTPLFSLEQ